MTTLELQADPSTHALIQDGEALFTRGAYRDALEKFDAVLAVEPGNVAALNDAGLAEAALGNASNAAARFERALETDPSCSYAFYNLLDLLRQADAPDLALEVFGKYGDRIPDSEEKQAYAQAFRQLAASRPVDTAYAQFVNGIGFHVLQPEHPAPLMEVVNTQLPEESSEIYKRLLPLLAVPRMSTFAIGAMINRAVSEMPEGTSFVNVGVWNGFTLLAGMSGNPAKRCVGIDNFSQFGGPREAFLERFGQFRSPMHAFYDMDYQDYFASVHEGQIGFYIYDGEHSYANQLEGLRVAEPFFADGCLILVDDTNWDDPRQATLDFIGQSRNEYRILLDKRTCHNNHPTFWNGVMILQKI